MKVISFNVRSANDPNGHSIHERAPRVKAVIDKYDPDLIGFQEVVPLWMEHIPEDYGQTYEIFHKFRCETFDIEGAPILWRKDRFECLDKGYFWLSDTPEIVSRGWDSIGCHRICMWVKLRDKQNNAVFHFINTHYGFSDPCQLASTKLIFDHFKPLGIQTAFMTGDFNLGYGSPAYKALTEVLADANKLTANDTRNTYHGYRGDAHGGDPCDFCFVTPQYIQPTYFQRLTETFDGKYPSDHFGLYIELEVRQKITVASADSAYSEKETEEELLARMSRTRTTLLESDPTIITYRNVGPAMAEKMTRAPKYEGVFTTESTAVYWKKSRFQLVKTQGEAVVLRHVSGKELCVTTAAAAGDMPAIYNTCNMALDSAEYRALRKQFSDVRRELAPCDFTPTYHGRGEDLVAPAISAQILYRGKDLHPVSYRVKTLYRDRRYLSDHSAVIADFAMDL